MITTRCPASIHRAAQPDQTARLCSSSCLGMFRAGGHKLLAPRRVRRCVRGKASRLDCRAMVNVDIWSPSVVLGVGLIASGVALFGVRQQNPKVSRDSDVVISSLITVTGGALIFQGWRLDPLLLLCQVMTCSVACWFALESLNLRGEVTETEAQPSNFEEPQSSTDMQQDNPNSWYDEFQPQRFDQGNGLPPPGTQFSEWDTIFQDESTTSTTPYQSQDESPRVARDAYEDWRVGESFGDSTSQATPAKSGNRGFNANLQDDVQRVEELRNDVGNSVESMVETVEDWE